MNKTKSLFYVYRHGTESPRVRHATFQQAKAEAERLANINPGAYIEILKAIAYSVVTGPATTVYFQQDVE